jgi:hypothetical protein
VYNVTFEGTLKANPQHPARGQSVEFTAPIRNTGNKPVLLKVWMNASGILTPAVVLDVLEPNGTRNISTNCQFLQSGSYSVNLIVEIYSNLTKPHKGRVQISGTVEVGDIDLRVDRVQLLRNKVIVDPKKDSLHNNDTITISMNISNMGDVNASDILIEGNNTTLLADKDVAFLEAGSDHTLVEVFTVDTDSDHLTLKVQVSGPTGYVDVNMSNNILAQEYSVSTPEQNNEITLGALLIIMVSIIIFLTLILVVYIVTVSREGKDEGWRRAKDGAASTDEAEDLKIDFIDYEEESATWPKGKDRFPRPPHLTRSLTSRTSEPPPSIINGR